MQDGQIIFKADVGVATKDVIQVQGVWVAPTHRGHRISGPALAAAITMMQQTAPTISLYVNDFNYRAIRLYRSLGFQQVGTFASVML
jgi:predicted GNAT family acetyltransferase